jgi:hypothetical protein
MSDLTGIHLIFPTINMDAFANININMDAFANINLSDSGSDSSCSSSSDESSDYSVQSPRSPTSPRTCRMTREEVDNFYMPENKPSPTGLTRQLTISKYVGSDAEVHCGNEIPQTDQRIVRHEPPIPDQQIKISFVASK